MIFRRIIWETQVKDVPLTGSCYDFAAKYGNAVQNDMVKMSEAIDIALDEFRPRLADALLESLASAYEATNDRILLLKIMLTHGWFRSFKVAMPKFCIGAPDEIKRHFAYEITVLALPIIEDLISERNYPGFRRVIQGLSRSVGQHAYYFLNRQEAHFFHWVLIQGLDHSRMTSRMLKRIAKEFVLDYGEDFAAAFKYIASQNVFASYKHVFSVLSEPVFHKYTANYHIERPEERLDENCLPEQYHKNHQQGEQEQMEMVENPMQQSPSTTTIKRAIWIELRVKKNDKNANKRLAIAK